jgi:hypothetical protein
MGSRKLAIYVERKNKFESACWKRSRSHDGQRNAKAYYGDLGCVHISVTGTAKQVCQIEILAALIGRSPGCTARFGSTRVSL